MNEGIAMGSTRHNKAPKIAKQRKAHRDAQIKALRVKYLFGSVVAPNGYNSRLFVSPPASPKAKHARHHDKLRYLAGREGNKRAPVL